MSAPPATAQFALLSSLAIARKGAGEYYTALLSSDDEIVRLGAYSQLLATSTLPPTKYLDVLPLCRHPGIKRRAFQFFRERSAFDLARTVAGTPAGEADEAISAAMEAEL